LAKKTLLQIVGKYQHFMSKHANAYIYIFMFDIDAVIVGFLLFSFYIHEQNEHGSQFSLRPIAMFTPICFGQQNRKTTLADTVSFPNQARESDDNFVDICNGWFDLFEIEKI
jgi:hypothetical protein